MEKATFGGGCFWCTEAIFQRIKGVEKVESGFSGGTKDNPSYEDVVYTDTGHAESIQVTFDPTKISYEKLLDIFWHTHNPTTPNQQNYDVGPMYRSIIFYHNNEQKKLAQESKMKVQKEFDRPIVTQIVPFKAFYKAEEYHQDYYNRNQDAPYCQIIVNPKLKKLLELYGNDIKEEYKESRN